MPSPEVLDFAVLMAPISEAKPTGDDPRTNSTPSSPYYGVKDARSSARTVERALMVGDDPDLPQPDWKPVVDNAVKALTKQAKDLEIVAYMIEGLVRRNGFVGLRDGFRLARELIEKYWDNLYPMPDEEGLETRVAPLTGLNGDDAEGTLVAPINRVPVTAKSSVGELTLANYQEALAVSKIADPKVREKKIAAGARSMDVFNKAVQESPPAFYRNWWRI
jgi:type VI secretion system protein ImpA